MRISLLVKLQDSTKLWQSRTIQVYVPLFSLCFLNSLRSTGLKFPIWTHHRIRPGYRAHMKRPSLCLAGWLQPLSLHESLMSAKAVLQSKWPVMSTKNLSLWRTPSIWSLGPGLVLASSHGTGKPGPSFVGESPFGFLRAACKTKTFYPNIYLVFINPDLNK